MDTLFNYLREFMAAITWPVAVLLIVLLLRKKLLLFIMAITRKVDKPGEISIGRDGISIKEYVDKKVDEKQNETIGMIERCVGKTKARPGTGINKNLEIIKKTKVLKQE